MGPYGQDVELAIWVWIGCMVLTVIAFALEHHFDRNN